MNTQTRHSLMLMLCALIWGTAFVAQSVGSDYMGPYTFLASRSWLACAFLLGLMAVLRKMGKTNPAAEPGFWQNKKVLLRGGIFCGVALFAASAAQQMGIGTTSTAKAGFMTALYVVLVPVAGVFLGSRPGVKLWCCVAASVVGLYLLCLLFRSGRARHAEPDRRRVAAFGLCDPVYGADHAGQPFQPAARRHPAELCAVLCGLGFVHDLRVCL